MRARARNISIRDRLFLAVGVPAAVLVIALAVVAWQGARRVVAESIQHELHSLTAMAASTVSPGPARFLLPGDEETRTYKRLVSRLEAIQNATGSSRVVLLGADEKVRADASGELPLFGPAPRLALDRAEFARALGGEMAVSVPFEDGDGRRYLAAYAKVPEREGDELDLDAIPMVLAVEAPAALLDLTDRVAVYVFAGALLAIFLVFLLAALVARTITAPVLRLAREAEALGQGRLEAPLTLTSGRDEVARLGKTLEDMRRALVDRDQERQMMLAGIAHEVRNPLGGMELFSGLLEEAVAELPAEPVSDAARAELLSHAGRIRRELVYLKGVVSDFLSFARDLPPHRQNVDVRALLEDVRSLKESAAGPRLVVTASVERPFPLDRGRVKEALLNLVGNAMQATPAGGEVRLSASLERDGRLSLVVQDTGAGMDEVMVARAFTPFFTTKEKGSGLGLPLAKKFARDHGGGAHLVSEPGRGTTVTLVLAPGPTTPQEPYASEDEPALLGDDEPALLG